jgi:hypothetical protein
MTPDDPVRLLTNDRRYLGHPLARHPEGNDEGVMADARTCDPPTDRHVDCADAVGDDPDARRSQARGHRPAYRFRHTFRRRAKQQSRRAPRSPQTRKAEDRLRRSGASASASRQSRGLSQRGSPDDQSHERSQPEALQGPTVSAATRPAARPAQRLRQAQARQPPLLSGCNRPVSHEQDDKRRSTKLTLRLCA